MKIKFTCYQYRGDFNRGVFLKVLHWVQALKQKRLEQVLNQYKIASACGHKLNCKIFTKTIAKHTSTQYYL